MISNMIWTGKVFVTDKSKTTNINPHERKKAYAHNTKKIDALIHTQKSLCLTAKNTVYRSEESRLSTVCVHTTVR